VLGFLLAFVLGLFVAALFLSANRPAPQQVISGAPSVARPLASTRGSAPLPDVNGISCDALESTLLHIHVHLAVFFDGAEQQIPLGIGIGQPWQVSDSAAGPFVVDGSCFYWLHTHTETGVVHIESPVRRTFTLGDFFAIWQEPLSAMQVGPAQGPVIAYVNGTRNTDPDPGNIALTQHAQIQLDVGQDVPPYVFDFPPGD
jgi:hypothetical protein